MGGPILFRGDSLVVRTFVSLIHTLSRQGVLVVLAVLRIVGKFVPYPYLETYPYKACDIVSKISIDITYYKKVWTTSTFI